MVSIPLAKESSADQSPCLLIGVIFAIQKTTFEKAKVGALDKQYFLYFFPLPQGHKSFLPICVFVTFLSDHKFKFGLKRS